MYILEGRGHTLLDGVKHPWSAGDVLNLPLKRDGIIVQHFNDDPATRAVFLACEPNWFACTGVAESDVWNRAMSALAMARTWRWPSAGSTKRRAPLGMR